MRAEALVCDEAQRFSMEAVDLPEPGPDQIAVRNLCSGVSIGTEFALIRNKLSWGPYPLCTGYMATGVVERVGASVSGFRVGDLVYHRGNGPMALAGGGALSSVSGGHCSHAVLRPHSNYGAAVLPAGVSPEVGSLYVPPAVGLFGVDMAGPRMGQTVVVYGVGLVGLGVVAACAHRGCVVIAVDVAPSHLDVARRLGADHVVDARSPDVAAEVRRIAPPGADVVFECTGRPDCVNTAVPLCRPDGAFVWQGNYGSAPVPFQFLPAHGRRLRMHFPCDDGLAPCRRAVVANMARGALRWEETITNVVDAAEGPGLFDRVNRGAEPDALGIVLRWHAQ